MPTGGDRSRPIQEARDIAYEAGRRMEAGDVRGALVQWAKVRDALKRPVRFSVAQVSLNAPCPCGSGRKYKRCCGR